MASGVVVFGPRGFRRSKYPRVLYTDVTSAGTTAVVTEETLATYTVPASTIIEDGMGLRVTVWGRTAANANNKTISLEFGGQTVFTTGALSVNNVDWTIEAMILRTGAATETATARMWYNTGYLSDVVSLTVPLTADAIIALTAQNGVAAANDIVCVGFKVEYLPVGDGS